MFACANIAFVCCRVLLLVCVGAVVDVVPWFGVAC